MPTKVAKKLPKRVGNAKRKQTRADSWNRNAKAKDARKLEQVKRTTHNNRACVVGQRCTGKMRRYNYRHASCENFA